MWNPISHAGLALLALASAPSRAAAPITQAAATKIADAPVAAWMSTSAAGIKALRAPGIVGFGRFAAPLVTDRATLDKNQDGFAAAKLDKSVQKQRDIQILGADSFVASGLWDLTRRAIPANDMTVRCTDVYRRTAGKWPIVTEHCSVAPTG